MKTTGIVALLVAMLAAGCAHQNGTATPKAEPRYLTAPERGLDSSQLVEEYAWKKLTEWRAPGAYRTVCLVRQADLASNSHFGKDEQIARYGFRIDAERGPAYAEVSLRRTPESQSWNIEDVEVCTGPEAQARLSLPAAEAVAGEEPEPAAYYDIDSPARPAWYAIEQLKQVSLCSSMAQDREEYLSRQVPFLSDFDQGFEYEHHSRSWLLTGDKSPVLFSVTSENHGKGSGVIGWHIQVLGGGEAKPLP